MSDVTRARFAVLQDKVPRCILSVAEKKDGTLILNLRANSRADYEDLAFDNVKDDQLDVLAYRYTLHVSNESENHNNTFNLHFRLANEKYDVYRYYTSAIKKEKKFAPLYARQCSNLQHKIYDLANLNSAYESLGSITPQFTLCFSVFIGPSDAYVQLPDGDFSYKLMRFQAFSLLFIWSFLSLPAHINSQLHHEGNMPGDYSAVGLTPIECILRFNMHRYLMRRKFLEVLKKNLTHPHPIIDNCTYMKHARTDTVEFALWASDLRRRHII